MPDQTTADLFGQAADSLQSLFPSTQQPAQPQADLGELYTRAADRLEGQFSAPVRQGFQAERFLNEHLQQGVLRDVEGWRHANHSGENYTTPRTEFGAQDWATVADELRRQFPEVDPEQFRDSYTRNRNAAFRQRTLQQVMENYRQQGTQDEQDYTISRLPFVGGGWSTGVALRVRRSAERIAAGEASSADYHNVGQFLVQAEQSRDAGIAQRAWDVVTAIPGFAAEFAATGGAFTAGRAGTTAAIGRVAGQRAATSIPGQALSYLGGTALRAAAMPQRVAATTAQMSIPGIQVGGEQGVTLQDRGSFVENLPRGYLDTLIEVGSEDAGRALPWLAGQVRRIPIPQRISAMGEGLAARWVSSAPGRTFEGFRRMVSAPEGVRRVSRELGNQFGYHGALGEAFEERVGDVLRGATGLNRDAQGNADYGMFSDALAGRWGEVFEQLAVEGLAFSAWGLGHRGVATAMAGQQPSPADFYPNVQRGAPAAPLEGRVQGTLPATEAGGGSVPEGVNGPSATAGTAPGSVTAQPVETMGFGGQARVTGQPMAPAFDKNAQIPTGTPEELRAQMDAVLQAAKQQGVPADRLQRMDQAFDINMQLYGPKGAGQFIAQQIWNYNLAEPGQGTVAGQVDTTRTTPVRGQQAQQQTARQQVTALEGQHLQVLSQVRDAERNARAAQEAVNVGLNRGKELQEAKKTLKQARKNLSQLEKDLDQARQKAAEESALRPNAPGSLLPSPAAQPAQQPDLPVQPPSAGQPASRAAEKAAGPQFRQDVLKVVGAESLQTGEVLAGLNGLRRKRGFAKLRANAFMDAMSELEREGLLVRQQETAPENPELGPVTFWTNPRAEDVSPQAQREIAQRIRDLQAQTRKLREAAGLTAEPQGGVMVPENATPEQERQLREQLASSQQELHDGIQASTKQLRQTGLSERSSRQIVSEVAQDGLQAGQAEAQAEEVQRSPAPAAPTATGPSAGNAAGPAAPIPGNAPPAAPASGPTAGGTPTGRGAETSILAPGLDPIPARYEVRELASLTASHEILPGGAIRKSEAYPPGLQPRDYNLGEEQAKILRGGGQLEPAYFLNTHPGADSGPPSIAENGVVINGNGRTMMLEFARTKGGLNEYKAQLGAQAQLFGIDPAAVGAMREPILVRVVNMDPTSPEATRFARAGNITTTQSQDILSTAANLSALIDADLLNSMRLDEDTTFSEAVNQPSGKAFRQTLQEAVRRAAPSQVPELFNPDGSLTSKGKDLVRNMLLLKVLPADLIRQLGDARARLMQGIEAAIPQLMLMVRTGGEADVSRQIAEALQVIANNPDMKTRGDADLVLNQGSLFGGLQQPISPEGRVVLSWLMDHWTKPTAIRKGILSLAQALQMRGGLFGEEMGSPVEIARNALGEAAPAQAKELFAPGTLGTAQQQQGQTGPVGPFEIIKGVENIFGVPLYSGEKVARKMGAVYKVRPQAIMINGFYAGNAPMVMHEVAHHLDEQQRVIPDNISDIPPDVMTGLSQFDYQVGRQDQRIAAQEGFAEYLRMLATGQLPAMTPAQEAAAAWIGGKLNNRVKDQLGRVQQLFAQFGSQGAIEQAARHISTTGQEAQPGGQTGGEAAQELGENAVQAFMTNVENNLAPLVRMEQDARRRGVAFAPGGAPSEVFFHLMYQSKAWAGRMLDKGVFAMQGGHPTTIGPSLKEILAPLTAEDKQPYKTGTASIFDVYAIGRHLVDEASKGRTPVDPGTLGYYQRALNEIAKNPEQARRLEQAANNLTNAYNATLDALVSVGFLNQDQVARLKQDKPTYVPLARVQQNTGWKAWFTKKGEQLPGLIKTRRGSGQQIVSPVLSYEQRLGLTSFLMARQLERTAVHNLAQEPGMGQYLVQVPAPLQANTVDRSQLATILERFGLDEPSIDQVMNSLGADAANYFTPAPWPKSGKPSYVVKVNGQSVHYRVGDKALYDVLTGQQGNDNPFVGFVKAAQFFLAPFAKMVRFGATAANYVFQFRNIFPTRDPLAFARNTIEPKSIAELLPYYGRAYAQAAAALFGKETNDTIFKLFQHYGGQQYRELSFNDRGPSSSYARAMGQQRNGLVRVISSVKDVAKRLLELTGAGELAPRALEFKNYLAKAGYTVEKIEENLRNRPDQEPIPLNLAIAAMNAAAEVTVPFGRQGVITREVNKIVPFFGPHIAGMSKYIRNFAENPARASIALAGLMGLALLHWLRFKDEPWYEELEPHWRHNYFVVPSPFGDGLWAFPASRDLDAPVTGLLQEMLRSSSRRNPNFAGWAEQAWGQVTPPVLPQPIAAGVDVLRNRRWSGQPLVPRRDQNLPATEQFMQYQGPYLAEQLTGGLTSPRRYRLNPFEMQSTPNQSVDQFYDRLHSLESNRLSAQRAGRTFAQESQYDTMHAFSGIMDWASLAMRGGSRNVGGRVVTFPEPSAEQRQAIEHWRTDVARIAQDLQPLHGNPFTNMSDLPDSLRSEVSRTFATAAGHIADQRPTRGAAEPLPAFQQRLQRFEERRDQAQRFLDASGVSRDRLREMMLGQARGQASPGGPRLTAGEIGRVRRIGSR